jgi:SAM-dependent MidA family methyltransferase
MTSLGETLKQSGGRALIFSNELVDAFPCRLFQKSGEGWQELGVWISSEGTLSEMILGSVPSDPWFEQFGPLPEGQRVERLDSYREWLKDWSPFWKEGSLLTIDYGDLNNQLYNRRMGGSLRAYYRHQRRTGRDLYARFGKQDLTADVNFTDLISWGTELGWKNASLITQAEFTTSWASKKSALSSLPTEAGDAFKVLEQTPHAP